MGSRPAYYRILAEGAIGAIYKRNEISILGSVCSDHYRGRRGGMLNDWINLERSESFLFKPIN